MGVCKCKQRNVTNQFCYVCRMNVCESCIVKDHQRCIIKSYVNWLQDSDYSETCSLCLESVKQGEVIRLTCYDLFHWDCFNKWALKFSENASSASYQCPDCKAPVFPSTALVSPVADVVRQRLTAVAWGRRGLGLKPEKLVEQKSEVRPVTPVVAETNIQTSTPISSYKPLSTTIKTPFVPLSKQSAPSSNVREKYLNDNTAPVHKVVDSTRYDAKVDISFDHDDNKYKRRGIFHWIGNLLKLDGNDQKKSKNNFLRRYFILVVLLGLFVIVVYLMASYGRNNAINDPMLDPDYNPHIRNLIKEND
ncbi:zinc finger protein-like 1 homolog isoform X2 [Hydra vulgaris]|uniref:Zinc finger protein-like 1 homolog isoform X2 n=1 Tax=Hydra vulgaris TaxID=6087 RepID=A0ABM4CJ50_HYDVU